MPTTERDYVREYRERDKSHARLHSKQYYQRHKLEKRELFRANDRRKHRYRSRWCLDVLGITYNTAIMIRRELRERCARTGEDFIELARKQNVLFKRERTKLGIDHYARFDLGEVSNAS